MDKKTFWKGFGIGVLFAAVILGTSCLIRTSDAGVIARAKKLGMVFAKEDSSEVTLAKKSDSSDTKENAASGSAVSQTEAPQTNFSQLDDSQAKVAPTPEPYDSTEPPKDKSSKNSKTSSSKSDSNNKKKMEKEKDRLEGKMKKEKKKLTIKPGDWSTAVSKELESMGVVESAKSFDDYLNKNGYSSSISAGSYSVSKDDTYKELAKKITGK